jgi:hypothetical protein
VTGADSQTEPLPGIVANDPDGRVARDDTKRLELAVAGLLGAQAMQRRPQGTGPSARAAMPASAAGVGSGMWIRADGSPAESGDVLLDRRARQRGGAAVPRIASGAIEQTARNWLDGALGMHTSVETCNYEDRPATGLSIDWGNSLKPSTDDTGAKKTPKPRESS